MQAYPFLYRSIGIVDDLISNVSYSLDSKGKLHRVCTEIYESNLTADNGGKCWWTFLNNEIVQAIAERMFLQNLKKVGQIFRDL